MRSVPNCFDRRYKALDNLIQELNVSMQEPNPDMRCNATDEPGIKLMCEFWKILKENPDYNLPQAVQQKFENESHKVNHPVYPQKIFCYMADNSGPPQTSSAIASEKSIELAPLTKVLCDLKEAATAEKKCCEKAKELQLTEKFLKDQIKALEKREQDGTKVLKQVDCMWSCMESGYQKSLKESAERQQKLEQQLLDIEISRKKWRKNKKDIESKLDTLKKCEVEIADRIKQKQNDLKAINLDVESFAKRIENNRKEIEIIKASYDELKNKSERNVDKMMQKAAELEQKVKEQEEIKKKKEEEGERYVNDARNDLQKLCKILLQKRLENEDLIAEKEALQEEVELLKTTSNNCKNKCEQKAALIDDEIKKLDSDIASYKIRCTKCNQGTDMFGIKNCSADCVCAQTFNCLIEDNECRENYDDVCVCQAVKHTFLGNVFENMYMVLEKETGSKKGKTVAEAILNSLQRSRNGKIDDACKKLLQNFIVGTVKQNINLTIVGGAVKTRCEMDPKVHEALMRCIGGMKVTAIESKDEATESKKDPCSHWGGTQECNCPNGPKSCICSSKAPPRKKGSKSMPVDKNDKKNSCPTKEEKEEKDDTSKPLSDWLPEYKTCRHRPSPPTPGGLCIIQTSLNKTEVVPRTNQQTTSYYENASLTECKDSENRVRDRIIEEVMGKYLEIASMEKVSCPAVKI